MGSREVPISGTAINQEGLNSKPSAHRVTLINTLCLGALSHCLAGISQREGSCKMESIRWSRASSHFDPTAATGEIPRSFHLILAFFLLLGRSVCPAAAPSSDSDSRWAPTAPTAPTALGAGACGTAPAAALCAGRSTEALGRRAQTHERTQITSLPAQD